MPWKKSFDVDDAIEKATAIFWQKGYVDTSMADLLEATGINRGSFYNAFESKRGIFVQALKAYDAKNRRAILEKLGALENPLEAIHELFTGLVRECLQHETQGCFLVNTAVEFPLHDHEIQEIVEKGLQEFEAFFYTAITQAMRNELIPQKHDAHETAQALLALFVGVRALARGAVSPERLLGMPGQAMRLVKA